MRYINNSSPNIYLGLQIAKNAFSVIYLVIWTAGQEWSIMVYSDHSHPFSMAGEGFHTKSGHKNNIHCTIKLKHACTFIWNSIMYETRSQKKKMWKKVKERRLFLKRKEDILGINLLKIFPASLNRSVYFIQFVIKTWNSHVKPTLCWHPTFWWFCLWKRKQDDLHLAQTKYWTHCDHDLQHICTCLNVTDVLILFTAMLLQCINWSTIYLPYRVLTHSYDVKSQSLIFISAEQDAEK